MQFLNQMVQCGSFPKQVHQMRKMMKPSQALLLLEAAVASYLVVCLSASGQRCFIPSSWKDQLTELSPEGGASLLKLAINENQRWVRACFYVILNQTLFRCTVFYRSNKLYFSAFRLSILLFFQCFVRGPSLLPRLLFNSNAWLLYPHF